MADTSFLRNHVEPYVRDQLATEFGQDFSVHSIDLRHGGQHEFNAVSADRLVVASIRTASGLTAGGRIPMGKINACLAALYYLTLVDAPRRLLVLTTPAFHALFVARVEGTVPPGIEIRCLPLPAELQTQVDKVVGAASREVTPAERSSSLDRA